MRSYLRHICHCVILMEHVLDTRAGFIGFIDELVPGHARGACARARVLRYARYVNTHLPLRHPNTARAWHDARAGFIDELAPRRAGVRVHVRVFFVNPFLEIHCASQSRGWYTLPAHVNFTCLCWLCSELWWLWLFLMQSTYACLLQVTFPDGISIVCVCVRVFVQVQRVWPFLVILTWYLWQSGKSMLYQIWVHLYV